MQPRPDAKLLNSASLIRYEAIRCVASLRRHLMKFMQGLKDEDHLAAIMFNAMALIHYEEMIERGVLPAELNDMPDYRAEIKAAFKAIKAKGRKARKPAKRKPVKAAKKPAKKPARKPVSKRKTRKAA